MNVPEVVWWLLVAWVELLWFVHPLLLLVFVLLVAAFVWEFARHLVSLAHFIHDLVWDFVHDPEWSLLPSPVRRLRQRQLTADGVGPATSPLHVTPLDQARGIRAGRGAVHGPKEAGGATPRSEPEATPRAADVLDFRDPGQGDPRGAA